MTDATTAYRGLGTAWAAGPEQLYDRLAEVVVDVDAAELRGLSVLDVGAGNGAACRALAAIGAHPAAVDTSQDMLERISLAGWPAVLGDMLRLPFRDDAFDAAVAAFSISHVDKPHLALGEMGRVVSSRGVVLAAVFAEAPANASKHAVDAVAESFGYVRPAWYVDFKRRVEPLSNTSELLRRAAAAAGLIDARIVERTVEAVTRPAEIVTTRLGMAHLAPFVATLSPQRRDDMTRRAVNEVVRRGQALRPELLILISRAP